jgi:hypothetical protein
MRKCLISLDIKEKQIKTTVRFSLTPVILTIIRETTNAGEDAGEKKPSYTICGTVNQCNHYESWYGDS